MFNCFRSKLRPVIFWAKWALTCFTVGGFGWHWIGNPCPKILGSGGNLCWSGFVKHLEMHHSFDNLCSWKGWCASKKHVVFPSISCLEQCLSSFGAGLQPFLKAIAKKVFLSIGELFSSQRGKSSFGIDLLKDQTTPFFWQYCKSVIH